MQLRALEPLDAPAYRALRLRGLREHPDAFTSSFEEESGRPESDAAARLAASSATCMWGAFEDGELLGLFGFTRELRFKNRHKAVLVGMYVAPEHAGRGIGRALVQAVLQDVQRAELELAVLTVTAGNDRARALYAAAGFRTIGIEPDAIRVDGRSFSKEHMYLSIPRLPGAA